jgi:hypothetical protein
MTEITITDDPGGECWDVTCESGCGWRDSTVMAVEALEAAFEHFYSSHDGRLRVTVEPQGEF